MILNLETKNETKVININDQAIEVKQYLPTKDKDDLIQITLDNCFSSGYCNEIKLEREFNINLVKMYTNLEIPQNVDRNDLYDALVTNKVLDTIIAAMDPNEYLKLYNTMRTMVGRRTRYESTISGLFKSLISELPNSAKEAFQIISQNPPESYKNMMEFVKAANGGNWTV